MFCKLCLIYQISILTTSICGINYDGYKLYEVFPMLRSHESVLTKIEKLGYDVWSRLRNSTKILVPPSFEKAFKDMMNDAGIFIKVLNENIKNIINQSKKIPLGENARRFIGISQNDFDFDRFLRYDEIVNFTYSLVRNSRYAKIINIGNSFEGRPIIGLKVEGSKNNPKIFIDAGIHAREWAAPITALYLMKKIVNHEHMFHNKVSIYVIPMVNPDGYEYSHTVDRLWRKTRSRIDGTECVGTDANRNFNSHWAEIGVDLDPCSEIFPGLEAFSEPETQAIRDTILTIKPNLYLTLHSYGPMLLYPWGFAKSLPYNWQELDKLAKIAAHKLKRLNGQDYTIGSSAKVLYAASGASDDWAMQMAKVPLVYTMELPDYGDGFIMPVEKIKPMVKETYEAFKEFVKYICSLRHTNCT